MNQAFKALADPTRRKILDLLKEGEEILFLYPGGGLGSGFITVDKNTRTFKSKRCEVENADRTFEL